MTSRIGRRRLIFAAAALMAPRLRAAPRARVVVVGAGFGGATCARYLKLSVPGAQILLIDARAHFLTGPGRNCVMAGLRTADSIKIDLARTAATSGVRILQDRVTQIDPVARRLTLAKHGSLPADFIVLAPGVAMRWGAIQGLREDTSALMPHAWTDDAQLAGLRRRLDAVRDGATILIGAPPNPYRCPPGPYERASLMAHLLTHTGRQRCKIVIADAKDDFSKSALFKLEWDLLYPGMIEWRRRADGGEVVRVDAASGRVWLRGEQQPIDTALASMIPAQQAAGIAASSDLCDESGWCPIRAGTFESARHGNVFVVGDAAVAAPMPKSAFAANSQAKLCAAVIAARIKGSDPPAAQLLNTCYSFVSGEQAISVSGLYAAVHGRLSTVHEAMSPLSAAIALRQHEAQQARDWYDSITADSFGRKPSFA